MTKKVYKNCNITNVYKRCISKDKNCRSYMIELKVHDLSFPFNHKYVRLHELILNKIYKLIHGKSKQIYFNYGGEDVILFKDEATNQYCFNCSLDDGYNEYYYVDSDDFMQSFVKILLSEDMFE